MIDTHCHLTDSRLLPMVPAILERCRSHNVRKMITIATSPDDAIAAAALADAQAPIYFAAGIHPNGSAPFSPADVAGLRPFLAHPKCLALGEIGLDLHWKDVPLAHQQDLFRAQLALAREVGKPVVIHAREAIAQTLDVMSEFPDVRAVFHCFTGTAQEAAAILARDYYLGFDGPLTYKKNDLLRTIAAGAPEHRILIETDAPYLTPEPHRGKLNEPALVRHVLATLAQVRHLPVARADKVTCANAVALFGPLAGT